MRPIRLMTYADEEDDVEGMTYLPGSGTCAAHAGGAAVRAQTVWRMLIMP
jgi:hypothetical protein